MNADNSNSINLANLKEVLSQSTLRSTLPYYAIAAQAPHLMGDYHRLVADAAYFRAERRGFVPGHEAEDWLAAEAEIALRLNEGR
jgi:hypothetical protein